LGKGVDAIAEEIVAILSDLSALHAVDCVGNRPRFYLVVSKPTRAQRLLHFSKRKH